MVFGALLGGLGGIGKSLLGGLGGGLVGAITKPITNVMSSILPKALNFIPKAIGGLTNMLGFGGGGGGDE